MMTLLMIVILSEVCSLYCPCPSHCCSVLQQYHNRVGLGFLILPLVLQAAEAQGCRSTSSRSHSVKPRHSLKLVPNPLITENVRLKHLRMSKRICLGVWEAFKWRHRVSGVCWVGRRRGGGDAWSRKA